jgi:hypothetical protein
MLIHQLFLIKIRHKPNMRGVTSSVIFHLVYMNSLKGYVSKLTVYWCGLTLVQVVK